MAYRLVDLNKRLARHQIELVKGKGYFYFAKLTPGAHGWQDDVESIYTCHFNHLSRDLWLAFVSANIVRAGGPDITKEND